MSRITVASLTARVAELEAYATKLDNQLHAAVVVDIPALQHQVASLTQERDALLVAQRPSRNARPVRVATPEAVAAHNAYRETLSAARELAIRTGKSVLVTARG